jgi:hypothetical protein
MRYLYILLLFLALRSDARASLIDQPDALKDVWLAFAVGKPYFDSEGWKISVYHAQSTSQFEALQKAMSECQNRATQCRLLPTLTTREACRYISVTIFKGLPAWVANISPKGLQIQCMGLFPDECSKPAGSCR